MVQNPEDGVICEWVRQCEAVEDKTQKEAMLYSLFHKLAGSETFPSVAAAAEVTRFCREDLGWSAYYFKMPRG